MENSKQNIQSPQNNLKLVKVVVLLLAILIEIFLIGFYKYNYANLPLNILSPNRSQNSNLIDNDGGFQAFYYTIDSDYKTKTDFKIFRVASSPEKKDENINSFSVNSYPLVIIDSWKQNTILFVSNSENQAVIYSLDISSQNSQPQTILTIPLNNDIVEVVNDVRFIDNDFLAFVTNDSKYERAENSVLHIFSLKDQQEKENYALNKQSPLYASFGFLAATPDNKTIYLSETGGDALAVWSQWYKVDRTNKIVQKLENLPHIAKGEGNPTISAFSPDGTKLAYADFSAVINADDLDPEMAYDEFGHSCLKYRTETDTLQKYESEGGTVMIQDLTNGDNREVFRNLSYANNYCKNLARRILEFKWIDNSRLAFETIDGIYSIDINTGQKDTIFIFEPTNSPGGQTRPFILSLQLPFVIFSDGSIVNIETNKQFESISTEAQKGNFFTF